MVAHSKSNRLFLILLKPLPEKSKLVDLFFFDVPGWFFLPKKQVVLTSSRACQQFDTLTGIHPETPVPTGFPDGENR
jgi:hypothetical protein